MFRSGAFVVCCLLGLAPAMSACSGSDGSPAQDDAAGTLDTHSDGSGGDGSDSDATNDVADGTEPDNDATDADASQGDAPADVPEPDGPLAQLDAPDDDRVIEVLPSLGPFVSTIDDTQNGFMPERLTAIIADVDVATFNAALLASQASVASARPGDPILSLQVPPMADPEAARALADELVESGAFLMAFPAWGASDPLSAPAGAGDKRVDGAGVATSGEQIRLYGAWNLDGLRNAQVRMVIADLWGAAAAPAVLSALTMPAGLVPDTAIGTSGSARGNHGFWVAGLAGADVSGTGVSGTAFRASQQLQMQAVQVAGISRFGEINHAIERALRSVSGPFILNLSIGYNDPRLLTDNRPARAAFALQWRNMLQTLGPDRVLVVTPTGNDGTVAGVDASLSSPYATQALVADLSSLIPDEQQSTWASVEALATALSNPRSIVGSTIVVGGADSSGGRFAQSTPGGDLLAPGEALTGPCVIPGGECAPDLEMIANGTSGASPLAAGVAAMAWGIDPTLTPASLRALVLGARSGELVDAFQVSMTAAIGAGRDPFTTLADSNDDATVDMVDVEAALAAWEQAEAAEGGPFRDWSRFDLNGDGFTSTESAIGIDLNGDDDFSGETLQRRIGDQDVLFDETAVTDLDVLCLAAWGDDWSGDDDERDERLATICQGESSCTTPDPSSSAVGEMRCVPAGTFTQGCLSGRDSVSSSSEIAPFAVVANAGQPGIREVTITRPFWMMAAPMTVAQIEALALADVLVSNECGGVPDSDCPATDVAWVEAIKIANALSTADGLPTCGVGLDVSCSGWRLPTAAELEYASRGGEEFTYPGSDNDTLVAWSSSTATSGLTQPACGLPPNGYGLCDMSGNVPTWAWDGFTMTVGDSNDPFTWVAVPHSIDPASDPTTAVPSAVFAISPNLFVNAVGGSSVLTDAAPSCARVWGVATGCFQACGGCDSLCTERIGVRLVRTAQ